MAGHDALRLLLAQDQREAELVTADDGPGERQRRLGRV